MTKEQVIDWLVETGNDATNFETTGLGFVMADIREFGFEQWLAHPPDQVTESFLDVTYDLSNSLMSDFRTMLDQERMLDELGVDQSYKMNQPELLESLNKGLIDVMRAVNHYFILQEQAKSMYTCN